MATSQSSSIDDFLLARIDEAEAAAGAALEVDGATGMLGPLPGPLFDHIAQHLPDRVLAECEAKRRIVNLHTVESGDWSGNYQRCCECGGYRDEDVRDRGYRSQWPCPTLRALALPYADHADFREEWRT